MNKEDNEMKKRNLKKKHGEQVWVSGSTKIEG